MSAAPSESKRSSVHHLHVQEHAKFIVQHGWEIAASFGDAGAERNAALQSVALADVSWLGKLECKGPWAASIVRQPLAGATPCPVTPERLIWIVEPSSIHIVREALEGLRAGQPRCYLIDMSSVHASFELVGPHVSDVLCKVSLGALRRSARRSSRRWTGSGVCSSGTNGGCSFISSANSASISGSRCWTPAGSSTSVAWGWRPTRRHTSARSLDIKILPSA